MADAENDLTTGGAIPEPSVQPKKKRRRKRLGLRATDPMAEAGRRIMAFHFARLRKLEADAAQGDEDAIHDMRVAIRRIRAAFRIAGPQYKRKTVKAFRAELRTLADHLGAARDLDVILNHGETFAGWQPPDAPQLDAWFEHLRAQRAEAQRELINYLRGKRFANLVQEFEEFVAEAGAGVKVNRQTGHAPRVCDVLPAAIWSQYSVVRSYEAVDNLSLDSLHALRIEFKRLRYLLEFFREVLGARVDALIKLAVGAQDHLGLLHDTDVAAGMLRNFVAEQAMLGAGDLAAMAAYLAEVQTEIHARQDQFAEVWQEIKSKSFRTKLARLLSAV